MSLSAMKTVKTVNTTLALSSQWNFVGISAAFGSDGNTLLTFYINNQNSPITVTTGYYADFNSSFGIFIGTMNTTSGFANFWSGTLYMFKIYSQALIPSDYSTSCSSSSCSVCPSNGQCLVTCGYDS